MDTARDVAEPSGNHQEARGVMALVATSAAHRAVGIPAASRAARSRRRPQDVGVYARLCKEVASGNCESDAVAQVQLSFITARNS